LLRGAIVAIACRLNSTPADPGGAMADQVVTGDHPDMDYAEHERTYRFFKGFVKWNVITIVVVLILMAFFLL
jgi:hypothetical protein